MARGGGAFGEKVSSDLIDKRLEAEDVGEQLCLVQAVGRHTATFVNLPGGGQSRGGKEMEGCIPDR